jgi:hypothetical protein
LTIERLIGNLERSKAIERARERERERERERKKEEDLDI